MKKLLKWHEFCLFLDNLRFFGYFPLFNWKNLETDSGFYQIDEKRKLCVISDAYFKRTIDPKVWLPRVSRVPPPDSACGLGEEEKLTTPSFILCTLYFTTPTATLSLL
ncbi:hypothetical protein Fmac_017226 [Flemingia macrophylla]|uniref:Uncharacterized protein n=1 Tax=Flemingia macrophylla TaxID=520843 RepID=A0ABD1M3E3_9FABA